MRDPPRLRLYNDANLHTFTLICVHISLVQASSSSQKRPCEQLKPPQDVSHIQCHVHLALCEMCVCVCVCVCVCMCMRWVKCLLLLQVSKMLLLTLSSYTHFLVSNFGGQSMEKTRRIGAGGRGKRKRVR